MFRTKDFVLLLVTVAFLLVAIVYTVSKNHSSSTNSSNPLLAGAPEIVSTSAVITSPEEKNLSRTERLERLRNQIANSELVTISNPEPDSDIGDDVVVSDESNLVTGPVFCPNYDPSYAPYWPVGQIKTHEAEGVRQYFVTETVQNGTTSSSTLERNILLTLPQQFIPTGSERCLPFEVVGVALDGSLIRNNEVQLYSIFSNETMIGYALDGFPIYGASAKPVDACGGRIELGQYRYELSSDRQTILNCYRGANQSFSQ